MSDIEDKEFVRLLTKSIDALNWCLNEAKDMRVYVEILVNNTKSIYCLRDGDYLREGAKLHLASVVRNTRKVLFAPKNESTEP